MKRYIAIAAMALGMMSGEAQAAPVKWTLNDVSFNEQGPGAASGSFVYDFTTNVFDDIMLTITGTGTALDGLYTGLVPVSSSEAQIQVVKSVPFGVGSATLIVLNFGERTAPGTLDVLVSVAGFCDIANCQSFDGFLPFRFGQTGTITGTTIAPIPLPAAGLMLLGALGGVAGLRHLRRH